MTKKILLVEKVDYPEFASAVDAKGIVWGDGDTLFEHNIFEMLESNPLAHLFNGYNDDEGVFMIMSEGGLMWASKAQVDASIKDGDEHGFQQFLYHPSEELILDDENIYSI